MFPVGGKYRVFPARAGMDRRSAASTSRPWACSPRERGWTERSDDDRPRAAGVPRASGDGPTTTPPPGRPTPCSPRERGWTEPASSCFPSRLRPGLCKWHCRRADMRRNNPCGRCGRQARTTARPGAPVGPRAGRPVACRGAQPRGGRACACASALREHARADCLNGASAASAVSFGAPPRGEHRRGVVLCGDEKKPIQTLERT